jgi:hypothetical protein
MRGDQVVARKRGAPIALAARHEDGPAFFIGKPVKCLFDG